MASRNVQVADASVAIRGDLDPFLQDVRGADRAIETMGEKLKKALSPRALTANSFGKGPEELARSFGRAADSADEAFEAVRKLDRQNIDTAKARKYADVLDEISIEAQQTLADLRQLASTDPRFNTPQIKAAADQLDRVGREAADSARSLREIKGVGASTEFERMAHEAREASTNLEKSSTKVDTLSGRLSGLKGILAGLGLAIGTQQILSFAGDASEKFRDLEQSGRTINSVFGDSASIIEDWGARSATAAGLSKVVVNQSASVIGQSLRNMGFDAEDAANEVVNLQQRASDLALAFGFDTQDAILGVTSLLRGEYDTIEKFGVRIKQVDINSRVAALGLDTSTDAAKRNAEAIAALDLFYEQTAEHAGRFADSQGDLSVELAQNQAEIDNGMAEIGRNVASIQLGAVRVADAVGSVFDDAALDFGDLGDRVHETADRFGMTFDEVKYTVIRRMNETGEGMDQALAGVESDLIEMSATAWNEYQSVASAAAEGMAAARESSETEADEIATAIPKAVKLHWQEIYQAGVDALSAYRAGVDDPTERQSFLDEIDQFLTDLDTALEPGEYIAELHGRKMELAVARGIAVEKGDLGAVAAIDKMLAEIYAELNTLNGYNWGYNLVDTIDQGMKDRVTAGISGAYALGTVIRKGVGINSEPEDPNSPLRGITKWGGNIVKTIAEGIYGNLGAGEAAADALAGALVPAMPGAPAAGMASGGVGGPTYILQVDGVPYSLDEEGADMIDQLLAKTPLSQGNLGQ